MSFQHQQQQRRVTTTTKCSGEESLLHDTEHGSNFCELQQRYHVVEESSLASSSGTSSSPSSVMMMIKKNKNRRSSRGGGSCISLCCFWNWRRSKGEMYPPDHARLHIRPSPSSQARFRRRLLAFMCLLSMASIGTVSMYLWMQALITSDSGMELDIIEDSWPPSPHKSRTGDTPPRWTLKRTTLARMMRNTSKPKWLFRFLNFDSASHQYATTMKLDPTIPKMCFVNVGRTAGRSLGCHLGFNFACNHVLGNDMWPHQNLPHAVERIMRHEIDDCNHTDTDYYLFSIRHPIYRMQSWFRDEYPTGNLHDKETVLFFWNLTGTGCNFHSLNDMAVRGLMPHSTTASISCQQSAQEAIMGVNLMQMHNFFNYGFFWNVVSQRVRQENPYLRDEEISNKIKVAAIRTEHMDEDWNSLEAMVNGHANQMPSIQMEPFYPQKNTTAISKPVDEPLSKVATQVLCQSLCIETQIYKRLLQRAVNLTPDQVKQSLDELREICPEQTDRDTCRLRIPTWQEQAAADMKLVSEETANGTNPDGYILTVSLKDFGFLI